MALKELNRTFLFSDTRDFAYVAAAVGELASVCLKFETSMHADPKTYRGGLTVSLGFAAAANSRKKVDKHFPLNGEEILAADDGAIRRYLIDLRREGKITAADASVIGNACRRQMQRRDAVPKL